MAELWIFGSQFSRNQRKLQRRKMRRYVFWAMAFLVGHILAGGDMVIIAKDADMQEQVMEALRNAVLEGKISRKRLEMSAADTQNEAKIRIGQVN